MISKTNMIFRPSVLLIASLIFCSFTGAESEENPQTQNKKITFRTSGTENGYYYVDLGLPSGVKWAFCNVGANSPEEFGEYFAWGEIKPKKSYTKANSETYDKDFQWLLSKGYIDNEGDLTPTHDAAQQIWGGSWRIPNEYDIEELVNYTKNVPGDINGVEGIILTSTLNGNSIFFPMSGYRCNTSIYADGVEGYYWSSSCYPDELNDIGHIFFQKKGEKRTVDETKIGPQDGFPIRAVCGQNPSNREEFVNE